MWRMNMPDSGYTKLVDSIPADLWIKWLRLNPDCLPAIARQMSEPSVDANGQVHMQPLTSWLLIEAKKDLKLSDDKYTDAFHEFLHGTATGSHLGPSRYSTDVIENMQAAQKLQHPANVRKWLAHSLASHKADLERHKRSEDEYTRM
jgi:hypothetical protein